jgi:hypothetical protein
MIVDRVVKTNTISLCGVDGSLAASKMTPLSSTSRWVVLSRVHRALFVPLLCCTINLSMACGANLAPVLQVDNAPVATAPGVAVSHPFVRDAILRALASRTWSVVEERPDGIVAKVSSGGHTASVLVRYDERSFSIGYVDSSPSLKYDGSHIHRRYNHWVDRLRASISQELNQASPAAAPVAAAPAPAPATAAPAAAVPAPAATPAAAPPAKEP